MANGGVFAGRSISVVNDLSIDEQAYLYDTSRDIKQAVLSGGDVSRFQVKDPGLGIYLFFLEDSTRTKESFRNAAKFHGAKVNDFIAQTSSITTKKESITDTVKMLFGYSQKSIFVVRSKLEGVCTWLQYALGKYADKLGYPVPSFINAGDGKHEHPTQEFLDEYTFLEKTNWRRDSIHLALVGDLLHGRTVHSKADGLKIFDKVKVDLIAPDELGMPEYYLDKMIDSGFGVRTFPTIESYLRQNEKADIWYFTRLQLERMGEQPSRVHMVGSPALDTIAGFQPLPLEEIENRLEWKWRKKTLLITMHSDTSSGRHEIDELAATLGALDALGPEIGLVLTLPNADAGGRAASATTLGFAAGRPNAVARASLGRELYLSCMSHCAAVVGNSSSGLYEAPSFSTPTVNIGHRQHGRARASSVIDVAAESAKIAAALRSALEQGKQPTKNPYGDGQAVERILSVLKEIDGFRTLTAKNFHDARLGDA